MFNLSQDVGIDLGTANTLVYIKNKGIVLREPSVVAENEETGNIEAVGEDARLMIGRTPKNIRVIRPMHEVVIADYDTKADIVKYYIYKYMHNRFFYDY